MRRLLQLGTILLVMVTLLVPVSEALDRWDAPGLTHDTEFRLFVIVLLFALVLLVSRLVAALSYVIHLIQLEALPAPEESPLAAAPFFAVPVLPPLHAPPLRI